MIFRLFRKDRRSDVVLALYTRVAEASRQPWLYLDARIPDTVEGRLESLMLHAFLTMRRLKALPEPAPQAAQDFVDLLFQHVDHGLRELGVGDVVVPKRMKKIAQNFYGRVQAYSAPLDEEDGEALGAALARNVPQADASALVPYLFEAERQLSGLSLDDILNVEALFPSRSAPAGSAALNGGAPGN